ncbi:hypothetical protein [Ideonella sp. A 288]|uniref:hypothetical protein n=1 Tax=Ideonella sp. A 288 TaxID=1962181 RepID=UPI000B4B0DF2|nr:hypothetical protein [Ideonella sp. A 288]
MFGSYLVELVIGLCFLFAVLGIVTSAVTEVVLSVTKVRARHLQEWLAQWTAQMLQGPAGAAQAGGTGQGFSLEALLKHPLVASQRRDGDQASYLPPEQLAAAFLQTLAMPFGSSCLGKDLAKAEADLRLHIATLQPEALRNTLQALLNSAAGKAADGTALVDRMREETAHWIDGSMNRIEGWTKRRAKVISLIAAAVVCVAFNVDVLAVMRALSSDPALRAELASTAVGYVDKACTAQAQVAGAVASAPAASAVPAGASATASAASTVSAGAAASGARATAAAEAAALVNQVQCLQDRSAAAIGALGPLSRLGIGWDKPPAFVAAQGLQSFGGFVAWVIGLACAALAASLGGDFWFKWIGDIVRLTGYKPGRKEPAPGP